MADNVELDAGTGGAIVATDQINASEHVQYVKLMDGTADSAEKIAGDAANGLDVDVTRSALPTGAATSANQTTLIGHVDGLEGLLTTIDADTGGILTSVQTIDNAISGTEMQVDVVAALPAGDNNIGNVDIASALPAGTNAIGKLAANSGVDIGDVDVASIAAGTNTIGNVGIVPRTTGGLSLFRSIDLDETEEDVKTSAGQVFGWYFYNDGAAEVYVQLYNATAANVTVGTTTPVLTLPVPAGAAANVMSPIGLAFGTAISAAATTTVSGADAPAANQVVANIFYS